MACACKILDRFMRMRDQTGYTTTHWILVVLFISLLVMVVTGKRWRSNMLMNLESVQNHQLHQIPLWVASAPLILHPAQLQVTSAGIDSLITALSEKVALVMAFWRYTLIFLSLLFTLFLSIWKLLKQCWFLPAISSIVIAFILEQHANRKHELSRASN